MNQIEVEIKSEWPLCDHPSLEMQCRICNEKATRTVEFGPVQHHYGTEVDLCQSPACLQLALEQYIAELDDTKRNRSEYAAEERWNQREGK